jgi:hypothetical protein
MKAQDLGEEENNEKLHNQILAQLSHEEGHDGEIRKAYYNLSQKTSREEIHTERGGLGGG